MKKLLFIPLIFFCSLAFAQHEHNQLFQGCIRVIVEPLYTFNFHRPRYDCKSGFGVCFRYNGISTRIVACDKSGEKSGQFAIENDKVYCSLYLENGEAVLHLPPELKQVSDFEGEDMSLFYVDDDQCIFADEKSDLSFRFLEGAYVVEELKDRLIVKIDIMLLK